MHLQGNIGRDPSEISRGLKELVSFPVPNSFKDRGLTASEDLMQILLQRYSRHGKCKAKCNSQWMGVKNQVWDVHLKAVDTFNLNCRALSCPAGLKLISFNY